MKMKGAFVKKKNVALENFTYLHVFFLQDEILNFSTMCRMCHRSIFKLSKADLNSVFFFKLITLPMLFTYSWGKIDSCLSKRH